MADLSIQSELLLELADRFHDRPAVVLGGQANLANALGGSCWFEPTDVRERDAAQVSLGTPADAALALVPTPPDRDLTRRQILIAAATLRPGGALLICGANAEGGKSAIKDAEAVFGPPTWSGYREKHRMAIFQKGAVLAPTWAQTPGVRPGSWQPFTIIVPGGPLHLETQAGVFAGPKLDAGTRLLLEHLPDCRGRDVLDMGCGVGVIGLTAGRTGAAGVTMTDANLLAVEAARHNAERLTIPARVIASDVYSALAGERFDLILSNPPFHRGKQVDLTVANRIIEGAPQHLHPGGALVVVANAFLAYGKQMERVFDRVETVAATPQFHVLRGEVS